MQQQDRKCVEIPLEGAYNVRDLGGYRNREGREIRRGRFIRSGALSFLTVRGIAELKGLADCVIDLRSTLEERNHPDPVKDLPEILHVHTPMLDQFNSRMETEDGTPFPSSMAEVYIGLLETNREDFREIFRLFAGERKAFLFHCSAGKDRTGVLAMLLLGLAGVDHELIAEDYSYSRELLQPLWESSKEELSQVPPQALESNPETILAAMGYLEQEYGGIVPYLDAIGIGREQRERVIEKLFAD